jgi:Flp pilus assembly protein CpaB
MGRRTIVLVIAIALAAVSAFAVWQYLSGVRDRERQNVAEVAVFRATAFIEQGTEGETARPLIEESTALRDTVVFEESQILCTGPAGVHAGDDPNEWGCVDNPSSLDETLTNKVAAGPISAGQLIAADGWVTLAELESVSLSESIEQGRVAIALRPDEVASVGGFVRPGDRVNIVASASVQINQFLQLLQDPELRAAILGSGFGQQEGNQTPPVEGETGTGEEFDPIASLAETFPAQIDFTQTVLQDLEVLAVGADTIPAPLGSGLTPQGTQVIVLHVTPEQAEKIEFARQYTTVALMLLPEGLEYTPFDSRGVVVDDLFTLVDRIQEQVEGLLGNTGN